MTPTQEGEDDEDITPSQTSSAYSRSNHKSSHVTIEFRGEFIPKQLII